SASSATYFRIFVSELLEINIEKVIYLDCDIVVRSDISELWNTDVSRCFLAAVEDCGIEDSGWYAVKLKKKLGMKRKERYFNAGVLVMNLKKLREDNIPEKIREFLVENAEKVEFADQDGLNAILRSKWLPLSREWNQQVAFCELSYQRKIIWEDMLIAVKDPKIVHYTTSYYITTKPWNYMDEHPFKKEYYRYLGATPWKNFVPSDYSFVNIILKSFYRTGLGTLFINCYKKKVKPTYLHETAKMPKRLTHSLLFKLIYLIFFPFEFCCKKLFTALAVLSYKLRKRNNVLGNVLCALFYPARYLIGSDKRESIRDEVLGEKYKCPCCGYRTLKISPPKTDEVCEICSWEYDFLQLCSPDDKDGANEVSLNEARRNFVEFGASDIRYKYVVRKPDRYDKEKENRVTVSIAD
ncbi:MAG TPA: glycosyltransferase, partial [Clostridia bacterium]